MAGHKGQGSTQNGRNSPGQRLGVKVFGGAAIGAGSIIARQRGTVWNPGRGVGMGKDHTLYALTDGTVKFSRSRGRTVVSVVAQ